MEDVKVRTLQLTSTAFAAGASISDRHTCEGANESPPLEWSGAPAGTRSFALIVDDPDAPSGTFVHWLAWDIPGNATELRANTGPQDIPPTQGRNGFGKPGYGGPCPPQGHGTHHYYFRLYALDSTLGLPTGTTRGRLEAAMRDHVLASAQLMGRYQRGR